MSDCWTYEEKAFLSDIPILSIDKQSDRLKKLAEL